MDDSETFRNAAGPSEGPDSRKPEDAKTNDPCCHGPIDPEKRRNLVISIDGTSNKFGAMNTNVIEHHSLLIKDERQIPYYNSGIGTYARPSWTSPKFIGMVLHHKIDLAIAWDFDKTVKDAYRWISENYETGDLIFMFGFSRGAFQVRVLSAMIEKVGLLHKGNELQIPFAYELYSDPETDKLEPEDQQESFVGRVTIAERFKRTFSRKGVKVHFVGVWDTVSSIGTVRGAKMLPGTIDGMKHVCFFRHALALDERRVKFLPEYANGGKGPNQEEMSGSIPHTKEVWFAGTHSDIGGGNAINRTLERTRPPLRWMVYEAGPLGLRTSPFERDLKDNEKVAVKESLTWVWWPFEYFPFRRLTYTRRGSDGKETTHSLHRGKVRKIQTGQKIHVSVISSNKYSPKASAPPLTPTQNGDFWGSLRTVGPGSQGKEREFYERWVELDLLDHIKIELESLLKQPGSTSESINKLLLRDEGQRAFYEAVLAKLDDESGQDRKNSLIKQSLGILDPTAFKLKMRRQKEVLSLLKIIGNPEIDYRVFLDRFSPLFLTYPKLNSTVFSVAFSPDGKWLASGLVDGSVLLWDTKSASQTGKALCGSSSCVASVAFSPDSKHLVSGLWDNTIRLWDVQKMEQVGDPWKGHSDCVCCVAFSPDGTKVVSASDDRTIKIWNPENGKEIAVLKGHEHYVHSVAFSPDGLHIVSGSLDQTVRIWDALKYQQVGEPLEGRSSWVWSVAYSPDNTHIASGSYDNTIRIWNAETGKQVGEPLKGHSSWVTSVCFSPDGKLLASGSADQTIQIWSTDTRVQIRELGGHDGWVPSVAFSPDGKTLASGSHDCTIRMWDIESYVKLYSLSTR
ncbi:WD40 repeat-like protein [Agrocybe pediades]|nr:WD40 repeat-like protein [Agrocybe pediades]